MVGLALLTLLPVDAAENESLVLPEDVSERVRELRSRPLGERIKAHSDPWLGSTYTNGPLGEAGGIDTDPMLRFDTFDCLTFVEEVLTLALAPDPVATQEIRLALRYSHPGTPTYENRRHFMLAQWIPQLIDEGWMKDITPQFPGAVRLQREVRESTWSNWSKRGEFNLPDELLPTGVQQFWYLPIEDALRSVDSIPEGSVVFTLRQPLPHVPIAITHVSITIPGDVPTLRHASKMGSGLLRDHTLTWYLEHLKTYSNWPVAGIILLQPVDFGPRRRE